jgi:aminoglycoside 2''-phosphotransferase
MDDEAIRFRALVSAAFPALTVNTFRFLAEGWDSTVWEVNGALVFRFPKRAEVAAWLRTEIALLPALAPVLPVPIPRFDYIGEPSASYPYPFVGYPKLSGVPLSSAHPGLVRADRLAGQIGALLTALHRFPVARARACGVEEHSARAWRDQYPAFLREIRTLYPRMTAAERERTERLFGAYLNDAAHARFTPVLLHQDLGGDHLLLDARTGDLAGVIDWGDVTMGDPAQDFCGLPPDWLRALLTNYGGHVDATFAARVAFYRALGPYHLLRFGLRTGGEPFIARGLAALARDGTA